jgi:hypothetical protein
MSLKMALLNCALSLQPSDHTFWVMTPCSLVEMFWKNILPYLKRYNIMTHKQRERHRLCSLVKSCSLHACFGLQP